MKKIFATLISAFLLTLGASAQKPVTKENPDLKISMTQDLKFIADGKTPTYITFYEENPAANYSSFQIEAQLPKGITVNKVKSGRKEVDDITLNKYRFDGLGHSLSWGMPEDGYLKMACLDMTANDAFYNDMEDGTLVPELFVIGLKALETAEIGEFTITLKNIKFMYKNADADVPVGEITAKCTVSSPAGIENITTDVQPVEYFSVEGKKLVTAQKGLNIVRMSDGTVKTVTMK